MYEGDSFFTLSTGGRAGLVVLSGLLAALVLAGTWWVRRGSGSAAIGVGAALALFWLFVWLSPQVYYTYYLALFTGLPLQLVIAQPPGPDELFGLLTFRARPTLADHSAGLLGWALLAVGAFGLPRRFERSSR